VGAKAEIVEEASANSSQRGLHSQDSVAEGPSKGVRCKQRARSEDVQWFCVGAAKPGPIFLLAVWYG
jgi:hypothetical protein